MAFSRYLVMLASDPRSQTRAKAKSRGLTSACTPFPDFASAIKEGR
jgi:hypothetical protein